MNPDFFFFRFLNNLVDALIAVNETLELCLEAEPAASSKFPKDILELFPVGISRCPVGGEFITGVGAAVTETDSES